MRILRELVIGHDQTAPRQDFFRPYVPVTPTRFQRRRSFAHSRNPVPRAGPLRMRWAQDDQSSDCFPATSSVAQGRCDRLAGRTGYALSIYRHGSTTRQCPFGTATATAMAGPFPCSKGVFRGRRWEMQLKGRWPHALLPRPLMDAPVLALQRCAKFSGSGVHARPLGVPTSRSPLIAGDCREAKNVAQALVFREFPSFDPDHPCVTTRRRSAHAWPSFLAGGANWSCSPRAPASEAHPGAC